MNRAMFIMVLTLSMNIARADKEWPEFRGPDGSGHSGAEGLPLQWSETENVTWSTPVHDSGWSSPVVWDNQIWMTTATESGKQVFAVCVNRRTGKVLHDIKLFDIAKPLKIASLNSHASPTPAIESGRVYVHFGSYGTACLDTSSGKTIWARRDLKCLHHMGFGSSPILFGKLLIFNVDAMDVQYVIALDSATGKTAWKTNRSADYSEVSKWCRKAFCTPKVVRSNNRFQLVSPGSKGFFAYDPDTGKELWKVRHEGWSMVARPLFDRGLIFAVTDFDNPELWAFRPDGSGDVTDTHVAWKVTEDVASTPSQLLVDGLIYMISDKGTASCIDARTGKVIWKKKIGGTYLASPVYAEDRIYLFNRKAETTVIQPGHEFKVLATNTLAPGILQATPAIAGKAFFIRTATHLYRVEK
ncbi:MAG: PQQ-binding-like beta-propeller repeat protein [Kiritimatiellia bacterium]|nr:PQQ-binding-like beta-propeller repeat protein [Kiritimatiellia bacterium]